MPRIGRCVKNTLHRLYVSHCVLCCDNVETRIPLCKSCLQDLARLSGQCPRCGRQHPGVGSCGRCQRSRPAFDLTIVPFRYEPPLEQLIHQFKYLRHFPHARLLGELLRSEIESRLTEVPEVIVPVPLHRSRLRWRGFNQSLELARPISRTLRIPIDCRSVVRARNTPAQAGLPINERQRNVLRAFEVRRPIPYRRIAIVDDVMTSGHTVNQLARCLKRRGAECVQVWALSRT